VMPYFVVLGGRSDDTYASCRSLWKKARKQIQQLKRPLIESPVESMIRLTIFAMFRAVLD